MFNEESRTPSREIEDELGVWRVRLLDVLIISSLGAGIFVLYPVIEHALNDPAGWPSTIFYLLAYGLNIALLLLRRLEIRGRIGVYLVTLLAVAAVAMAVGGLAGSGRMHMMAVIALATALLGWQGGTIAAALSLIIFSGVGVAISQGHLIPLPASNEWWFSEGTSFAFGITLLLITQVSFVNAHQRALQRAQQAEIELTVIHARQLRLARDLHDETVQQMYGVILVLRRAISNIQKYPEQSLARLTHALELSTQAWQGLRSHLQALGQSAQPLKPTTSQSVLNGNSVNLPNELIPYDIQMVLIRLVQEAMSNVYRHSCAVQMKVEMHVEPECVWVGIEDNGVGFDVTEMEPYGFGLVSLREQVTARGGVLAIDSAPGAGTRLSVTVPLGAQTYAAR